MGLPSITQGIVVEGAVVMSSDTFNEHWLILHADCRIATSNVLPESPEHSSIRLQESIEGIALPKADDPAFPPFASQFLRRIHLPHRPSPRLPNYAGSTLNAIRAPAGAVSSPPSSVIACNHKHSALHRHELISDKDSKQRPCFLPKTFSRLTFTNIMLSHYVQSG